MGMGGTIVTGRARPTDSIPAGTTVTVSTTVSLPVQFDFAARDFTMTATPAIGGDVGGGVLRLDSVGVRRVLFGDRILFDNAAAEPMSVVAASSFLRRLIDGHEIRAGLSVVIDIEAEVTNTSGGAVVIDALTINAVLVGMKPTWDRCA